MLSVAAIVLSVVALSVGFPVSSYPGYPGYNTPGYNTQQPLYYYYYTPSAYPATTGYSQYPLSYAPGYATPTQYAPLAAAYNPALPTSGYTFASSATSDAPTTTLPTFQTLTEFLQNILSHIQRPFKPSTGGSSEASSDETATGTTYYTQPQTNGLFVRPTTTRYSYSYPGGQPQQAYAGSASYYPYAAGYNSPLYFPRYQNNQPLTTA